MNGKKKKYLPFLQCFWPIHLDPGTRYLLIFWETLVSLLNSFVPFKKQIKYPYHIELHLSCRRVPGSTYVFFLLWHPGRLLRKEITSFISSFFRLLMPTLTHWPIDSRNYLVLRVLMFSCKIFRIYGNSHVVW